MAEMEGVLPSGRAWCVGKIEKIVLHIIYLSTSTPSGPVLLHSIELPLFRSMLFHGPQKQSSILVWANRCYLIFILSIFFPPVRKENSGDLRGTN